MQQPAIYTFGYTGRDAFALECRVRDLGAVLVDIRYSPRSHAPAWRGEALAERFGGAYRWVQALGNRNYRGTGIEIADLRAGLQALAGITQPMVLLCACADYAHCHRAVVADALRAQGYDVRELDELPSTRPGTIKAISLCQPWASLVALGEKCIETRSWPTRYRGPLAIHASKRWRPEDVVVGQRHPAFLAVWRRHGIQRLSDLPLGAVIATCQLQDCLRTEEVKSQIGEEERAFGDYTIRRWAWMLADVTPLAEPISARGALGLWDWEAKT